MGTVAQVVQNSISGDVAGDHRRDPRCIGYRRESRSGFATLTSRLRGNRTPIARMVGPLMGTAVCVYAPTVAALTFAYTEVSRLGLLPVPGSSFGRAAPIQPVSGEDTAARRTAETRARPERREHALRNANMSFATALVQTLEESDRTPQVIPGPSRSYTRDIASKLGLSTEETSGPISPGLVHDIGKIGFRLRF